MMKLFSVITLGVLKKGDFRTILHNQYFEISDYDSTKYQNRDDLVEVQLTGEAKSIIGYCFYNCQNLRILRGNEHITYIGSYAINLIPNIEELYFPSVEEIESSSGSGYLYPAFTAMNNLKIFYFPKLWVTFKSLLRFEDFTNLVKVNLSSYPNLQYDNFRNNVNLQIIQIDNITAISDAFYNCSSLKKISAKRLKTLQYKSFENCINLKEIDSPNLEYIGNDAFANCMNLETINLSNVEYIGENAFTNCTKLKNIVPPKFLYFVGENALAGFEFEGNITIKLSPDPDLYRFYNDRPSYHVCPNAFGNTKMSSLCITNDINVAPYAFANSEISIVSILKNVTINSNAFANSKINELYVGDNSIVEPFAFTNIPSLETVTLINCGIKQDVFFMTKNIKSLKIDGIRLDLQSGCFQTIQVCIYYFGNEDYYKDSTILVIKRIYKAIFVTNQYPADLKTFCEIPVIRGFNNPCPAARTKSVDNNNIKQLPANADPEPTCQECISNSKSGYFLSLLIYY